MGLGDFKISFCLPGDLKKLIRPLDEEFVFSKNRKISLAKRFNDLFSKDNCQNILAGKIGNEIVSCLAIRPFKYFLKGEILKGAIIGCVFTKKTHRGLGFGRALVKEANRVLEKRRFDFAVLWTTLGNFYKENGWFLFDNGFFGVLKKQAPKDKRRDYKAVICLKKDFQTINYLQRKSPSHIIRGLKSYDNLPLPATQLRIAKLFFKNKVDGYIIFGIEKEKKETYVYEVFSKNEKYDIYLDFLLSYKFNNIFINSHEKNGFKLFLDKKRIIEWEKQKLRMFKIVNKKINKKALEDIHVSFFDKI